MVLLVQLESLAEEASRYELNRIAYLSVTDGSILATVSDGKSNFMIQSVSTLQRSEVVALLTAQDFVVHSGKWLTDSSLTGQISSESVWVCSVSYKSSEEMPGLWVQRFGYEPSPGEVLRLFYEEMSHETGQSEIPLEPFLDSVSPNVVVSGPDDFTLHRAEVLCNETNSL